MAEKVQQYSLGDRIGTGGTGIVRRARNTEDKSEVAIKTLQNDISRDPVTRKRLLGAKKQLQGVLPHENIARVLDIVEANDMLHVVMEYAHGKSLESSLGRKGRPMTQESAVNILNQVLRGAVAAHSKGVLHGNLKASDIIVSNDAVVRVSGFGIAKNLSNSALLRTAGRMQTLPYLAPEQVRGEASDERADVYSLGVILYRMITGKLPFASNERGAEARIRHAILNEPLPDIAETMPELNVSPNIVNIIRRAMAKDRRERIPSTREFSRLVQKAQLDLPTAVSEQKTSTQAPTATSGKSSTPIPVPIPTRESAAMQFPPPSTPIEQQVSVMEPVRTLSTPPSLETPSNAAITNLAAPSSQEANTAETSTSTPSAEESKEKSLWNLLTNPGNITTPAAEGEPTLRKSASEIEVERRMQALRASQAAQMQAPETQAISNSGLTSNPSPIPQENLTQSTPFASADLSEKQTPQAAFVQGSSATTVSSPSANVQSPVYATNAGGIASSKQEEKKKRSVVPWLVMGAMALGGGIYYIALKNNNNSTASNTAQQKPLSQEEIERQYDSLSGKSATAKPNDSNAETISNPTQTDASVEKPLLTENTATDSLANTSSTAQKPSVQESAPTESTPTASKKVSEKKSESKPESKTESKTSAINKQPRAFETSPKAEKKVAKIETPTKSVAKLSTPKPSVAANTEVSSENGTPKRSNRSTPKASNDEVSAPQSPKSKSSSVAAYTPYNSASPNTNNVATQDGEREAARKKIRSKYASHLSKKSDGTSSNSIAANTNSGSASTTKSEGKSIPNGLKNTLNSGGSTQATPKTNRDDNYTPKSNPVDATNEVDPSATALESASRKAVGAEPYLILRGHVANVRSVSYSPDGKLIASGSEDKTVKIWDASTGTVLRSLRGHGHSVTSVFFSPDSKFVISSGKDKTVRIWDVETGNAIQRSPGVSCEGSPAAFSPDGGFIATANNRNINISKVQK